ncbi:PIG-L family deacetylase [Sphingobacterium hungaricum]
MNFNYLFIFFLAFQSSLSFAQSNQASSSSIMMQIDKLNVLGSVLYFAAHPDDENTRLIAWLSSDRNYKTSYLSLTRGDGGQNLIGSEQGINLGLIRTQELLAARKIDQGEQYFSSAYDFGFSKTHEETFKFWEKEEVLREAVWIIRKLKPDVIITRFPPDERGGHGHHQASAILAHEAFIAAADPKKFPEQLDVVDVWQAKRLLWNTANFGGMNNTSEDQLKIDIGHYNPLLGQSYGEVAALSRSQHKSQGFGSAASRGQSFEYFEYVAGEPAKTDLFDGVNTTWGRVANSAQIQTLAQKIQNEFDQKSPQKSVPDLVNLYQLVEKINDVFWREEKLKEIQHLILDCAGIWMQAKANSINYTTADKIEVRNDLIVRNPSVDVQLLMINGQSIQKTAPINKLESFTSIVNYPKITQPYWLKNPFTLGKFSVEEKDFGYPENPDHPKVSFVLSILGTTFTIEKPIQYSYVDPVRGEVFVPISVTPDITGSASNPVVLLANGKPNVLQVTFTNQSASKKNYSIEVKANPAIQVTPHKIDLTFKEAGESITQEFEVTSQKNSNEAAAIQFQEAGNNIKSLQEINYDHIPKISWFPELAVRVQPLAIEIPIKKIAYIAGAGDLVPEALRAVGISVDVLSEKQLASPLLNQYDAVVFGVRAFNVNAALQRFKSSILSYVENGGTVLMQYNVNSGFNSANLGPYPFSISRNRVTEEDAAVKFDASDKDLNFPNKITAVDFDGWVQERGLYFAENIDKAYRTPLRMHDVNEPERNGSLLIADYGKGKFVYTSLAFFRQLPAGVPGAYRLFVNLLTKEN